VKEVEEEVMVSVKEVEEEVMVSVKEETPVGEETVEVGT